MHDSNLHVGVGVSGEFAHGPTRPLIHRHPTLHGFTLVELLVVVAIIVVLLALLVPSMSKAIVLAERTKCAAQMHGWGLALSQYGTSNQFFFPDNHDGVDTSWVGVNVLNFFAEYLVPYTAQDDNKMLDCPTQTFHPAVRKSNNVVSPGLLGYFYLPSRTPGQNNNNMNYQPPSNPYGNEWVSKKKYGQYSRSPILMDMKQSSSPDGGVTHAWGSQGHNLSSHATRGLNAEPDGSNFLFEDASVIWYESEKIAIGGVVGGYAWYKIPEVQ